MTAADQGTNQFTNMLTLEGLTWGNVDGRTIPRLAAGWQWEESGLRLRLQLRKDVYFHDGTPLTGHTVADILMQQFARPQIKRQYSSFADVTALYPQRSEVVFELARRSAFLPDDLDLGLPLRQGVGTGPFRVARRDGSHVLFDRFERYYQGRPALERIEMRSFDALRNAWSSLLRGEVDMVTDVPGEAVEFVGNNQVDVIRYKRRYQYMLAFNSSHPSLSTPAVRRALNLAVDREGLIKRALRGFGSASTGPLWPRHWAYDSSVAPYPFDPRGARDLLDAAGKRPGAAGTRSKVPGARLTFTCLLLRDFSLHERLALELQKQLYDIGVDVQFDLVTTQEFNERMSAGRFEAVLIDMISGPSFGRPYIFFRSAKNFEGMNQFGYENAEAERLFETLRSSALNEAATRSATNRLQRVFLDDPPALFLAWSERARVVGRRITPVIDPDRDPVLTMWRWMPRDQMLVTNR